MLRSSYETLETLRENRETTKIRSRLKIHGSTPYLGSDFDFGNALLDDNFLELWSLSGVFHILDLARGNVANQLGQLDRIAGAIYTLYSHATVSV